MLGGLAVLASSTQGQSFVMDQAPGVGFKYQSGDISGLAGCFRRFFEDRTLLEACKQASLAACRKKFNWDIESKKFILIPGKILE